jgi:FkbM family methyltransferase
MGLKIEASVLTRHRCYNQCLSNTAVLYLNGSKGINVEPNPLGIEAFKKYRPKDINLNVGIGLKSGNLPYWEMQAPTLNTFNYQEALHLQEEGYPILREVQIPVITLNELLTEYAGGSFPDFLSLDAEGQDLEILEMIEYGKTEPKVICVETIEFQTHGISKKDEGIITFLQKKGYLLFADTYINTIFVRRDLWASR